MGRMWILRDGEWHSRQNALCRQSQGEVTRTLKESLSLMELWDGRIGDME